MKIAMIILALASAAGAQSKSPASDALREMLGGREKNIVAAFEEMPADKYEYKPTSEQMSFGHLAVHIADANNHFCANVGDVPQPKVDFTGKETKEQLLVALKASFEFCRTALAKADDAKMAENIKWFDGKERPRAWAFLGLASSWADHYGAAAMYLRLNGLLPPTAKKKE
ncbi:MAG TPA: DinB family protein [Terriglobales bacterium]|nr:DinB family protein [Terriglobales bacterium]